MKVLVIPVQFSDATADSKGYTIEKVDAAFNGTGTDYYSVSEYYYQSSYGKLNLEFVVLDNWFMPQYESTYYASQTKVLLGEVTAIGDQMIMREALLYLDERGWDLSQFDADINGRIDAVVMINTLTIDHANTFYWAYKYTELYVGAGGTYDGVYVNDYVWAPYQFLLDTGDQQTFEDQCMNTYTYIHEFGHILGADDYYDTSYRGCVSLHGYDVMDAKLGDQNAYTKFNYGWLTTSRLVTAEEGVTLTLEDFSKNGDTIIIANNWDDELGAYQEYYLLVYYTNGGLNDSAKKAGYFAEEGILVYHVNASLYDFYELGYDVYNSNTHGADEIRGTWDNLISYVKSQDDGFVYTAGDKLPTTLVDDQGNKIKYTFVVDSITEDVATITFTKL